MKKQAKNAPKKTLKKKHLVVTGLTVVALAASIGIAGCSQQSASNSSNASSSTSDAQQTAKVVDRSGQKIDASSITTNKTYDNSADGEHAIIADGGAASYEHIAVNKTGNSDGDEADFYGENAAIFATNGATLTLSDAVVKSDGKHANGIFSYGEGTTVNVSHTVINTTNNCSGGLMTTGGGTMNATDVTAQTTGNSSAAIRSDRGGGTVNVNGGYFTAAGSGSPVIYSTADITVSEAYLESTSAQGVVIEGKNSATLKDCQLIADNTSKNSDNSDTYQAVMIYQSMSGDASVGQSAFEMDGGSLENKNGDIFFVNNTACTITLNGAYIANNDANGLFLRAAAAGWGTSGSNGGKVILNASKQTIEGSMLVDSVSVLNAYLKDGSSFRGAINPSGQTGDVYVEIDASSTWTLTEDSYVSGLTCKGGSINLNGHTLYVNGVAYSGGDSTGTAIEIVSSSSASAQGDGTPPSKPGEQGDSGGGQGGSGNGGNGGSGGSGGGQGGGTKPDAAPEKR